MAKKYVLPAIFTAEDKLSAKVAKMTSKVEAKLDKLQRKWRMAGDKAFATARKYAVAGTMIVAPMALMANEAIKFESQMSNVATLIDTNAESIEKMGDKVLDLSTKLPVPINELTASLYDIRSAGIAADDQFATLETSAKLSAAGLADVKQSTDVLTSALNAFESQGLSAEQTADILFKTVKNGKTTLAEISQAFGATAPIIQSAGISLEDFSAATAALTTTGTPASQAQNQIRASVIALQKPTQQMTKIYKKLGVASGDELVKKYGSLGAAYQAINDKSKELNLNNGKVWGSTEALAAVTSLTGATNDAYVSTLDDMVNGTNALNDAYDKQAGTGKASMQILKNQLQSTAITLGQALLPVIIDLMKWITPMIKGFANWTKRNKGLVQTIGKVAVVAAGLSFAVSGLNAVVGTFYKVLTVGSKIMKAWQMVVKIATAVQWLWNVAMNANPIGAIIIAVTALTAVVYGLSKAFSSQTTAQRLNNEVTERALENSIDQRVEVTMLFAQLRKLKVGSDEYSATLAKIEKLQPGITEKYNLQAGAVRDLAAAEAELTANILERAKSEARAEMIKEKYKEAQQARDEGGTGNWLYDTALWSIGMEEKTKKITGEGRALKLEKEAEFLADQEAQYQLELADKKTEGPENVDATKTEVTENNNNNSETNNLVIDFKNPPPGMEVSGSGGSGVSIPNMTSTR